MIYNKLKESPEYQEPEVFLTVFPQWRAQRKSWEVTRELPGQTFTVNGQDKPRSGYPMLVRFKDIKDPKSVTKVEPTDLAAAFGPGVKLRRITVTVTDEAVTSGIGKRLGWFRKRAASGGGLIPMQKSKSGRYEVVPGYDASLSEIGLSDFSTEAYK